MNKNDFFSRINKSAKPVIVDLWAPWCGPCRAMQPAFKQISQKYAEEVFVFKINADESPEVLKALGVRGIPTVIGFAHGKEILRRTGMQSAQALDILFDSTLNERKPSVMPLAPIDRILRAFGGLALLVIGWIMGQSIILIALGAVLVFSAVYDRCPIYNAIAPRLAALFHKS
jgi:thioredoxin 1